jgi:protein-S-isoprenylcysteine O-methyltransferase Ste14
VVVFASFFREMLLVRRSQASAKGNAQDAGSLNFINIGSQLAMLAAFVIAFLVPAFAIVHRVAAFWGGIALLIAGTVLRRHCWRVLGQHFTGAVIVSPDQPVIERGAYRFVRHPSYTGGVMMFAGIGLALGNWLSFAIIVLGICAVYAYRVAAEERALIATLGQPYVDYMRRCKRFIPWVV